MLHSGSNRLSQCGVRHAIASTATQHTSAPSRDFLSVSFAEYTLLWFFLVPTAPVLILLHCSDYSPLHMSIVKYDWMEDRSVEFEHVQIAKIRTREQFNIGCHNRNTQSHKTDTVQGSRSITRVA